MRSFQERVLRLSTALKLTKSNVRQLDIADVDSDLDWTAKIIKDIAKTNDSDHPVKRPAKWNESDSVITYVRNKLLNQLYS
jgi:hypothetical protein